MRRCLFSAALQMSNEIIRLCFQSISLDKIFKGYELSSKSKTSVTVSSAAWPGRKVQEMKENPRKIKKKQKKITNCREGPLKISKMLD